MKKILIIGSGGREHSIGWKIAGDDRELFFAPGNGGTQEIGTNFPEVLVTDIFGQVQLAKRLGVDVVIVPQDDALAGGAVDELQAEGFKVFGPTKAAARLESSKAFAKEIMRRAGVKTAKHDFYTSHKVALANIHNHGVPVVIKADGLALGKGVRVCQTVQAAELALHDFMVKKTLGVNGENILIEEFLAGPEISGQAYCDSEGSFTLFPECQDHKPVFDGDLGPNTGGMGTISPVPGFASALMYDIRDRIVKPILKEMRLAKCPFVGCLYPGLKITQHGLFVLEFNARPGDSEMQTYARLLNTDLLDLMEACVDGTLSQLRIEWGHGHSVCVNLASGGYPGSYKKGFPITGIEDAEKIKGVKVFHAGTKWENGMLVTNGGRVLNVTAKRDNLEETLTAVYNAVECIQFEGKQYRTDIGTRSMVVPPGID